MDGKAFRKAVRNERFGDDDLEMVYKTLPINKDVNAGISNFRREIESRLEPPNSATNVKPAEDPSLSEYVCIYLVSVFEKQAEDFGMEAEVVSKETIHSYVQQTTGQVYLPKLQGTGPAVECGARCNVCDESSYKHALHAKGTMLPFMGNARILLELGVDVDASDAWGETALMHACATLNEKTIRWLLAKGANPNCATKGSKATALHRLVEAQGSDSTKSALVKLLVDHKANPSDQSVWGVSPLHIAALLRLPETCRALLATGASNKVQDWRGRLPADFGAPKASDSDAKRKEGEDVVALLRV